MNRVEFQKILSSTSQLVESRLSDIGDTYISLDKSLHTRFSTFFEARKTKKLLKPTLFRIVYEMYGGRQFSSLIDVAVIFELMNISSYQSNAGFDNKMGAYSKAEKDSQIISSFLTRELINKLTLNLNVSDKFKLLIVEEMAQINEKIYLAQHYDLNMLSVNNYDIYRADEAKFYNDYYERCRLGSGYFSGACARIAALMAGENVIVGEEVFLQTEKYGALLHMVNDLGDYMPNSKYLSSVYKDSLSDFRNGRLTLPLFLLLKESNTDFKNYDKDNILESIQPYLIEAKNSITSEYKKLTKGNIIVPEGDWGRLYKVMLSTLKSNKYFYQLKS